MTETRVVLDREREEVAAAAVLASESAANMAATAAEQADQCLQHPQLQLIPL